MCDIISVSSIYELNLCRSPLYGFSSVIHSLGYLVTLSSLHFENFSRSIELEATVVESNFLESFTHVRLAPPYLLDLFLFL